jgi:hypothetical protein
MQRSITDWRSALWIVLLVAASIAFSRVFACATPFAALATIAALSLPRREAMIFILFAWAANQLIGYCVSDYPRTLDSFFWGGAIGLAAVASTLAARLAAGKCGQAKPTWAQLAVIFVVAMTAYEGVLLVAALTPMGGLKEFTIAIVGWVVTANLSALAVLYGVNRLLAAFGFALPVRTLA